MTYCYICDECGWTSEKILPSSKAGYRPACPKCRARMRRDHNAEQGHVKTPCSNYPMESDAAGVHPSQVKEAMEFDRLHGVPTEYTKEGNPIYTSREHRKRHCETNGLYDRNAGYGDATPKNNMRTPKNRIARIKERMAQRR